MLDYFGGRATSMTMLKGQLFVGRPVSLRHAIAAIYLSLAILLPGCASTEAEAQRQAAIAEQAFAQGDLVTADLAINEAIQKQGEVANFYLLSARIKVAKAEYFLAYEAYKTVTALDPNNLEALVGVAVMSRSFGDTLKGREAMKRALEIDPNQIDILMTQGAIALEDKNYDEAAALGDRVIAAYPSQPSGYVLKARSLTLRGKNQEALTLLRKTVDQLGNSVLLSGALLEAARVERDVETMRQQYGLIAAERPNSSALALDEINLLYKVGQQEEARQAGQSMLERFGNDATALRKLKELWVEYDPRPFDTGELAQLRETEGREARLIVARQLMEEGQLDEAAALLVDQSDARVAGLAARVAQRQGRTGALQAARTILGKDKTNCDALGAIAEAALAGRRLDEAVQTSQTLATQCSDRNDGYILQARAYELAGKPLAVERVFRDGIETHPTDPELTRRFVAWLFSQNRPSTAVAIASKLIKLAPVRNSSWEIYGATCKRARQPACETLAAQGLQRARLSYSFDAADTNRRNELVSRQWN